MIPTNPPAQTYAPSGQPPRDAKTNTIIVLAVGLMLVLGLALPLFIFFYPEYQREQLIKTGLPAQAEILTIEPTGNTYNDQPQARILLLVTPETGESFEAETTMIINPIYAPQFQPGKRVKVRYDANDKTNVAIEETESGQR
ncbi:DUF3592 domain-containing protein [Candidatus Uhrbacteria bacterium]|nr:DUF3592 domain-containing protein [Candidatus Uhrbacteria bacterium]